MGFNVRVTEALRLGLAFDDLLARYEWDTSDIYGDAGRTTTDRFPTRIRVGAAYQLMDGQTRLTVEYESRLSDREVRSRTVGFSGDGPVQGTASEELMLHAARLRVGAEYRPVEAFAVRAGVDRLGAEALGGARPSAGFMVAQALGSLQVRGEYAAVLEPYTLGTMHFISLRVYL